MTIGIIGDIHLGRSLEIGKPGVGGHYNSRVIDQIGLLDWCRHEASVRNVTDLVLTGDITEDSKPDYYLIHEFFKWLVRCTNDGIHVHVIRGNHDFKRFGNNISSPLDLLSSGELINVTLYREPTTFQVGSVGVTILPFLDKRMHGSSNSDAIEYIRSSILNEHSEITPGNTSILIGHLALEGSIPIGDEFDDSLNELICPLELFKKYHQVWMGHVHKYQVIQEEPVIAHIGSMDRSNFGESDEQKYMVIIDEKEYESIRLPVRPLVKFQFEIQSGEDATDIVLGELSRANGLAGAIVKIEIRLIGADLQQVSRKAIVQYLDSVGIHHLSGIVESRCIIAVPPDKVKVSSEIDPKEAVAIWADQKEYSDEDKEIFLQFCLETIEETND
jgi:exonuclease SbcD